MNNNSTFFYFSECSVIYNFLYVWYLCLRMWKCSYVSVQVHSYHGTHAKVRESHQASALSSVLRQSLSLFITARTMLVRKLLIFLPPIPLLYWITVTWRIPSPEYSSSWDLNLGPDALPIAQSLQLLVMLYCQYFLSLMYIFWANPSSSPLWKQYIIKVY